MKKESGEAKLCFEITDRVGAVDFSFFFLILDIEKWDKSTGFYGDKYVC